MKTSLPATVWTADALALSLIVESIGTHVAYRLAPSQRFDAAAVTIICSALVGAGLIGWKTADRFRVCVIWTVCYFLLAVPALALWSFLYASVVLGDSL